MHPEFLKPLRPEIIKHIQFELAANLATEWHVKDWRLRRVERIKTIDEACYHQKTSFQFLIPSERFFKVLKNLLELNSSRGHNSKILKECEEKYLKRVQISDLTGIELPLIIPLDRFPKRILLGFSIRDSNDKPIPFQTRYEASILGYRVLRNYLAFIVLASQRNLNRGCQ